MQTRHTSDYRTRSYRARVLCALAIAAFAGLAAFLIL